MKDILSLFVSNEEVSSFIKKTFRVTLVLLVCNLIYAMVELKEWYDYVQKIPARSHSVSHYYYYYMVWPAIAMISILTVIIGSALNYQGYSHLTAALKRNEDLLLALAFKKFYAAYLTFLISTTLLILDAAYRTFFVR